MFLKVQSCAFLQLGLDECHKFMCRRTLAPVYLPSKSDLAMGLVLATGLVYVQLQCLVSGTNTTSSSMTSTRTHLLSHCAGSLVAAHLVVLVLFNLHLAAWHSMGNALDAAAREGITLSGERVLRGAFAWLFGKGRAGRGGGQATTRHYSWTDPLPGSIFLDVDQMDHMEKSIPRKELRWHRRAKSRMYNLYDRLPLAMILLVIVLLCCANALRYGWVHHSRASLVLGTEASILLTIDALCWTHLRRILATLDGDLTAISASIKMKQH